MIKSKETIALTVVRGASLSAPLSPPSNCQHDKHELDALRVLMNVVVGCSISHSGLLLEMQN